MRKDSPQRSSNVPRPKQASRRPPRLDDRAVVAALQTYRAEISSGKTPSRRPLLAHFPEIANEVSACLDALDFLEQAAAQL